MNKRVEERALEIYPQKWWRDCDGDAWDANEKRREGFIQGYEQAEKDIIAIIESRIYEIIGDAQPKPALRAELQELIERIKNET